MNGRINTFQSLGAVDGPGLRYVVFMQGCPLHCPYCHNPETRDGTLGEEYSVETVCERVLRCRPYFGETGGITVSGGEPLSQAPFVAELFSRLRARGIHTALDTSGAGSPEAAARVLAHTDLVLCDIKFSTEEAYRNHCGGSLAHTLAFLRLTEAKKIPLWVRHVVVPGLTDSPESLLEIKRLAESFSNLEKIEWLPFKNLCEPKYGRLGIPFPMAGTPALSQSALEKLLHQALDSAEQNGYHSER